MVDMNKILELSREHHVRIAFEYSDWSNHYTIEVSRQGYLKGVSIYEEQMASNQFDLYSILETIIAEVVNAFEYKIWEE